jgi:Tfp pilus assembly protein PilF
LLGMVYGKQGKKEEALAALADADRINPHFVMTYVYRGNVFEVSGDCAHAVQQYQQALTFEHTNEAASAGIARLGNCR